MAKTITRKTAKTNKKSAAKIANVSRINPLHYAIAFVFFVTMIVFASSMTNAEEANVSTPETVSDTQISEEINEAEAPVETETEEVADETEDTTTGEAPVDEPATETDTTEDETDNSTDTGDTSMSASVLFSPLLAPSAPGNGNNNDNNNGSIITTDSGCSSNINHYETGNHVYIKGTNFDPEAVLDFVIGKPGNSGADVATGTVTTDINGNFCTDVYTIGPNDSGEYQVKVDDVKGDNYQVKKKDIDDDDDCEITDDCEEPETPSCPFEPQEGRTIVSFPPDQYTGDDFLIMYGAGHPQKRGPYNVDLDPGTYKVTLFGYDGYAGRSLLAPWDLQEYEQWHVTFFDANDNAVASSSNTTDLEDGVDYAESTDIVDLALEIISPITKIFTYHMFNNEENIDIPHLADHNIPNSVHPVCAAFDLVPQVPKGNLFIKKYSCTADTSVTRDGNGPDLGGNHTKPESCVPEQGVRFGFIHQADKNDGSGPYPGYDDGAEFEVVGETSPEGGVSLAGLDAVGRYNIAIIDEDNKRVPESEAGVLGMFCYGDTGGAGDTYEFTFIQPNETGWCIVYNNNRIIGENNPPIIALIGSSTINLIVGDTFVDPGVTYSDPDGDSPLVLSTSTDPLSGVDTSTTSTTLITYVVTDPDGLSATTTRTVNVNPANNNNGGGGNGGGNDNSTTTNNIVPEEEEEGSNGGGSSRKSSGRSGGLGANGSFTNSIGQVLGASTSCSLYLNEYIKAGAKNNPEEVTKLQIFLNEYMGENIPVTGIYGPLSLEAVKKFQLMWRKEVLKPWVGAGLHTSEDEPTGYVYKTTKRQINNIVCPELRLPIPELN